jgi:hypothetical protein
MAGLLDIFGTGGTQTLGLLGMSPEDIQRNRDDAQAQALYGLAARLFQGGNTGASIAEGLQQGQKLYSSAMQNQLQEQLQGFQMKDLLEKRKREQEALARQSVINRAVAGAYQPARQAQELYGEDIMGQQVGEGVIPARAAGLDLQSLAPVLMASPEGRKTLAELVESQKAMRPETFSLAEGAQQFERDPFTGQVRQVASGAPKREPTPAEIQGYNLAKSQGFEGSFLDYQAASKPAATPADIQGYKLAKQEGFKGSFLDYQIASKPPSTTNINMPSEGERKSAVLANRMNFGVAQMNEAIGKNPNVAMPNTAAEAARFFTGSEFLANKLTPEQRQVVETAQLDVLDAALTLGTGAAYTTAQLEGYRKSYFPQLNDKPEAIKSKQKRLENLLKSAEIATGRAASSVPTKIPAAFEVPTLDSILGSGRPRGGN